MYIKVISILSIILKALVYSAHGDQMINNFFNFQSFAEHISKEYFENSCSHIDSNQSMTKAVFLTLGRSRSSRLKKLGFQPKA